MQRTRVRDTAPELMLRSALHSRGLRYRLQVQPSQDVRSTADLVFPRERVAVYVDGCFWHACPLHGNLPKRNRDWWAEKLARNQHRDRETDAALGRAGWHVVRVWEHDCPAPGADRVEQAVLARRANLAGVLGRRPGRAR